MSARLASNEWVERVLAAIAAALIIAGSLFLWIGIPLLGMWIAGELTSSPQGFLFAVLGGIPLAMIGTGFLLYRLNATYERLRHREGGSGTRSAWLVSQSDERSSLRRARAPRSLVDVALTTSAVLAIVLVIVWFFFLAEMHLAPMQ